MNVRRLLAEALGTFVLVLVGPGAAVVNAWSNGTVTHVGVALAFAFVICAMVYSLGHLSGAHLNPAVTVAFWSVRRFPSGEVLPYIVAQCLGGVVAGVVLRATLGASIKAGVTLPMIGTGSAFLMEVLLSFALMFVIMSVATDDRVPPGFAALAIGLTVGFCALMAGPLTGASMNPARSLGPAAAAGVWRAHWLYWVAPIVGTTFAAHVYEFLRQSSAPSARLGEQYHSSREGVPTAGSHNERRPS